MYPVNDGWIGIKVVEGANYVRAARVKRSAGLIITEMGYSDSEKWTDEQLALIALSDEYQRSVLWLYHNKFV